MILVIDNYDSFTYNVVQYLGELGAETVVHRNDEITVEQIVATPSLTAVVLSPGPCTPNEAGVCLELLTSGKLAVPLLGLCLGHQAIAQAYGGEVVRARRVMHGKASPIHHAGQGVFRSLDNPITGMRYHSLVVEPTTLPDCLEVTAWTEHDDGSQDEIMGFRHRELPIEGIQFHPESIATTTGHTMLKNFLEELK